MSADFSRGELAKERAMATNGDRAMAVTQSSAAATVLDVISRAARDPAIDVDKLDRLLALQERYMATQSQTAYFAAMARLQAKLPQIGKAGTITDGRGNMRNRYAKLEDIDSVIRPLMAEEGFAPSYDSEEARGGIRYTCKMVHRDGHSESKSLTLPIDGGAGRSGVQAVGSTTSYARRYLLAMHLNLVTCDEDDDGSGGRHQPAPAGPLDPSYTKPREAPAHTADGEVIEGGGIRHSLLFDRLSQLDTVATLSNLKTLCDQISREVKAGKIPREAGPEVLRAKDAAKARIEAAGRAEGAAQVDAAGPMPAGWGGDEHDRPPEERMREPGED